MPTHLWDRAALVPQAYEGRLRPEVVALPTGTPTVGTLFTFMRDAELRFETLRMRIEERTATTRGEHLTIIDTVMRHPADAKVTTSEPHRGTAANYELWISDGEIVKTYSAIHKLGTERPVRHTIRGLDDPDFPGSSRVYWPLTPLPMETVPDVFVHPGGFCQNVLATGQCWISGTDDVQGREAIVLECDHPRTTEVWTDRPDHHYQITVDRETGVILRLVESVGASITRHAEVVAFAPNASLPPGTFDFEFPADTTRLF